MIVQRSTGWPVPAEMNMDMDVECVHGQCSCRWSSPRHESSSELLLVTSPVPWSLIVVVRLFRGDLKVCRFQSLWTVFMCRVCRCHIDLDIVVLLAKYVVHVQFIARIVARQQQVVLLLAPAHRLRPFPIMYKKRTFFPAAEIPLIPPSDTE